MKTKYAIVLALSLIGIGLSLPSKAESLESLPAALPEFMNEGQLTKWNADKASVQAKASTIPDSSEQFYTGKLYVAEAGGYVFKFRTYNPETSRWTSSDPKGFPDGPNNQFYAPIPTCGLDKYGLYDDADAAIDKGIVGDVIIGWDTIGDAFAAANARAALGYSGDKVATTAETTAMKADTGFTSVYNQAYFQGLADQSTYTGSASYNENSVVNFDGSDLHYAYGHVAFSVTGSFSYDANNQWSTTATFTFSDLYDFGPSYNPAIIAFRNLQENHYAGYYTTTGSFTVDYHE